MSAPHRSGFATIVGRPNVGKSTLMNALVGERVAITTPIPQTTRTQIRGVMEQPGVQVVFVDTPGLHKPKTALGGRLNESARGSLADVDVVLFVVDGPGGIGRGDRFVAGLLADAPADVIAVVNKVDRVRRGHELPMLQAVARLGDFAEIVPVSATRGDGLETMRELIVARMPEGPAYYPSEQRTDQTVEQRIAEIVRERAMVRMREEVPHSIAVEVAEIRPGERLDVQVVDAVVFVERDSQKPILIGRRGAVLAEIGTEARAEIEALLGSRVYLDLRVKLLKEWQSDTRALDRLGY